METKRTVIIQASVSALSNNVISEILSLSNYIGYLTFRVQLKT